MANAMVDRLRRQPNKGAGCLGAGLILIIMMLIVAACSVETVQPGTVGVVTYFGAVQDEILPEGLHFIWPGTQVIPIDVRVQKVEAEASASSKDLQIVTSRVALNFVLEKSQANMIFQQLGLNYQSTVIEPAIQESIKSTTAQFTAEELITERPLVKESVTGDIRARLAKHAINVTDFSIVDFNFSTEFNRAIEQKEIAEQDALRAQNDLDRIRTEAEQVRARAEGEAQARLELAKAEAEAQRLLRETLSAEIIQLRTIEKWNGTLPLLMGDSGAGLFFDIAALQAITPSLPISNTKQGE